MARVEEVEQRERVWAAAARARWDYRIDTTAVHVVHRADATVDTAALAEQLLDIRRTTGVTELRWDDAIRTRIERDSGVDVETWWRTVAPSPWRNSATIPETRIDHSGRTTHVSAHSSFGAGGFSGPHC